MTLVEVPPPPNDDDCPWGTDGQARKKPDPDAPTFARTDLGNAERFILDHGSSLRFCVPWKGWLWWSDGRWTRDDGSGVAKLAAATVRAMAVAAFDVAGDEERANAVKWAMGSQSAARLRSMVELAQHMAPIRPDELDRDPWLLGCPNGTIELRTGQLRPPRRDDYITRCTGVPYDADARAPRWSAFLKRIFDGDGELIAYVQRAAGYSMTGTTGEQELFLCVGSGANGKSALLSVLKKVLGEYALTAPFDLFTHDRHGRNKGPGLATLDGPRLVMAAEPNPGAPLDESLIKSVTGGDTCVAERKYQAPYEFLPRCTLWLAANAPPVWRHGGPALARRVRVVPFRVVIPKSEQVADLPARIAREEGPGVLAWIVRGCLKWQRNGLAPPDSVLAAGEDYELDVDPVAAWISERLQRAAGYRLSLADAHADYSERATAAGLRPVSSRTLGALLDARGWTRKRAKVGQIIVDCALVPRSASD